MKKERKIYQVLERLHAANWSNQIKTAMDTREWLGAEFDRLHDKIDGIHPVHVNMDEEVADAVLDKMRGPLTISQKASDWIKENAPVAPVHWTAPFGYSSTGGMSHITLTPDGTINMEIRDRIGEIIWRGEFTPPDYRKEAGE